MHISTHEHRPLPSPPASQPCPHPCLPRVAALAPAHRGWGKTGDTTLEEECHEISRADTTSQEQKHQQSRYDTSRAGTTIRRHGSSAHFHTVSAGCPVDSALPCTQAPHHHGPSCHHHSTMLPPSLRHRATTTALSCHHDGTIMHGCVRCRADETYSPAS